MQMTHPNDANTPNGTTSTLNGAASTSDGTASSPDGAPSAHPTNSSKSEPVANVIFKRYTSCFPKLLVYTWITMRNQKSNSEFKEYYVHVDVDEHVDEMENEFNFL
jgi:hypothetical protein